MAIKLTPEGGQSYLPDNPLEREKPSKSQAQLDCEAKGGRWDEQTQTCILKKPKLENPEIISDKKGNQRGIVLPDGRMYGGLKQSEVQQIADAQRRKTTLPEGTVPFGTAHNQERAEAIVAQERQRLISQEMPQITELNPKLAPLEEKPIIGSIVKGIQPLWEKIMGKGTAPQMEQVLTFAKNDIQRKEIEKGLTWSESVGALVEGMPGGAKATSYLNIETPRGNLEEVHKDILSQYRRISGIESNVKMGYLPIEVADTQIKDIEQYILKQEARLRLLIQNSPSLNFNSDRVNGFETDILKVKEKLFQAKLNILTGAETDPSELDIYMKQQQQQEPEWATSPW